MQDLFSDALESLLRDCCTPAQIRAIEDSGEAGALWAELLSSGFADALVPERQGGAGLGLNEVFPLVFLMGRYALPVPLAHTMVVRAALSAASTSLPTEAMAIAAGAERLENGMISCPQVPFGRVAKWVMMTLEGRSLLLPVKAARLSPAGGYRSLNADLLWPGLPDDLVHLEIAGDCLSTGAAITAALLAGALERVFEMSVSYANERIQFGKPIAKFQAIQQQMSVMAEQVFAAKMAAQIGLASTGHQPDRWSAAVAKLRTGEAVMAVSSIAHAVHGAIGFTEEYDLQLYTRRLHEWRLSYGSEAYWAAALGTEALHGTERSLDFVRERIALSPKIAVPLNP